MFIIFSYAFRDLCCAHFFSPNFATKTSKYSNETAKTQELDMMTELCKADEPGRRKRDAGSGWDEEEEEEKEEGEYRTVPGIRGGGGGMRIPVSPEAHRKRQEKRRSDGERRDLGAKFKNMGLDFDEEWKKALRENLVMMRNGEEDWSKVDKLAKRPVRGGLKHNATHVG